MEINVDLLGELLLYHSDRYHIMNLCFADAIKDTNSDDGAWGWIHPDVVFANGSFSTVATVAQSGKRLMLASSGLRTYRHFMLPILLSDYQLSDGSIAVPARDLVKLSIDYMTPSMKGVLWDNYGRGSFHWGVFWHVNNQGILQRAYNPLPILIYPERKDEVPIFKGVSIEVTDYLERSVPNRQDVYIVEDTDEFYICSLEDEDVSTYYNLSMTGAVPRDYLRTPSIIEFALIGKNYIQGVYARDYPRSGVRYRYCNDDADGWEEWEKTEAQSGEFVNSVFSVIELFNKYPSVEFMAKGFRRLERRIHKTTRRIKRSIWIRMFAVLELAMVQVALRLFQGREGQNA